MCKCANLQTRMLNQIMFSSIICKLAHLQIAIFLNIEKLFNPNFAHLHICKLAFYSSHFNAPFLNI